MKTTVEDVTERVCEAFPYDWDLRDRLIALGYVGSVSHGTAGAETDDLDLMGIVVPPEEYILGLRRWGHNQKETWDYGPDGRGLDVVIYSARKMVSLMLKQNPNVLGFLWLRPDHYVVGGQYLERLITNRDRFVSKQAYNSFAGYAYSQLKRLQQGAYKGYMGEKRKALVDQFGYDPKNAGHLIRLLRMAVEFLDTGEVNVWRGGIDAEELRRIKAGEWSLSRIQAEAENLFEQVRAARDRSPLPDRPDHERAERLLMSIHREFIT